MVEENAEDKPRRKKKCPGGKPTYLGRRQREQIAQMAAGKAGPPTEQQGDEASPYLEDQMHQSLEKK